MYTYIRPNIVIKTIFIKASYNNLKIRMKFSVTLAVLALIDKKIAAWNEGEFAMDTLGRD